MQQRVDPDEKVQEAIDTCPVSCIHWVRNPGSCSTSGCARVQQACVMVSGHALVRRQARCIWNGCATLLLDMQVRLVACRAHGGF